MKWPLRVLFIWASLRPCQGLELEVSDAARYLPKDSNLSISCSDADINDLDWLKNKKLLSACTQAEPCSPIGPGFTVDHSSNKSVLNLYRLKYSDCGTYNCTTRKGYRDYTVRIMAPVEPGKLQESDGKISITTSCVLPTYSVDIRWFYIHQDGSPREYDKPAIRDERTSDCTGACGENAAKRISSSLQFPPGRKHTISVKMMAYIRQGGSVDRLTSSKEYLIETCPPDAVRGELILLLVWIVFCLVLSVSSAILRMRRKSGESNQMLIDWNMWKKTDVHIVIAIGINALLFIVCLVLLISNAGVKEPRVPDILDRCFDNITIEYVVAVVSYFLIAIGIAVQSVYYNPFIWDKLKKCVTRKQQGQTCKHGDIEDQSGDGDVDDHQERQSFLKSAPEIDGQDSDKKQAEKKRDNPFIWDKLKKWVTRKQQGQTCKHGDIEDQSGDGDADDHQERQSFLKSAPEIDGQDSDKKQAEKKRDHQEMKPVLESASEIDGQDSDKKQEEKKREQQYKTEADVSLHCKPKHVNTNELYIDAGRQAILECTLESVSYPSWQKYKGPVINFGGQKTFETVKDRVSWEADKKSLNIKNVQVSDAGTYTCLTADGQVQTVNLVVILPSKTVKAVPKQTNTLTVGGEISREYPLWKRVQSCLNAELHTPLQGANLEWNADKTSLDIKNFGEEDEGVYEVSGKNLIQHFFVSLTVNPSQNDMQMKVKEGQNVRLECSKENENYPVWECVELGVLNIGGQPSWCHTELSERLSWSVNRRSLLVRDIRLEDSGTYLCRHSDGTMESVIVIVESKPDTITIKKKTKGKLKIQHNTGHLHPSLTLIGSNEVNSTISYQNYNDKKFKAKNEHEGELSNVDMSEIREIECSTFRGCVKVYQIKDIQDT